MQLPTPNRCTHRFESWFAHRRCKAHKIIMSFTVALSKAITKKIKALMLIIVGAPYILTIDYLRLFRMQLQLATCQTSFYDSQHKLRLSFCTAVDDDIIRISDKCNTWMI